nr:MAG: hypothetical protein [Bacteriophage sp.]
MIPVTQFILGNSDPLLYPSEKMTNSIDEQIAFLQSQKQAINEAYRRNAIPNANNGTTQNQQVPTQGIWDAIDAKLFEEWFGGNIDNKVFESAITFWFKDVDFDGDKVWKYFHMNN